MIQAVCELGRRYAQEIRREGVAVTRAEEVYRTYASLLEDLPVEEFHVAILDGKHRIHHDVLVSRGVLNAAPVHPREVFRAAIAANACAVILVHNHPSGDPDPSEDDRVMTYHLVTAGTLLGIAVVDHVIIGGGRYVSFAEGGLFQ
jgi:DNA repair protein RadC